MSPNMKYEWDCKSNEYEYEDVEIIIRRVV